MGSDITACKLRIDLLNALFLCNQFAFVLIWFERCDYFIFLQTFIGLVSFFCN
jgi:hypothetical protein